MAVDSSIALGFKPPQYESPMNALAGMLQVQAAQQQNQLGTMKMDEYKRGVEDQNALRSALSAPDADPYKVLLQRGKVKEATDYQKAQADVKKTGADTEKSALEAAHKRIDTAGQAFGYVRNNPTVEAAFSTLDYLGQNGIFKPEQVAQYKAQIQANPGSIKSLADQAYTAALGAKEQLGKISTENLGGAMRTQSVDPVTGKVSTLDTAPITQSADNAASNARMAADAAAGRAVTMRGQNMTDGRAKEANKAAALSQPFTVAGPDGKDMLVQQNKATGQLIPVSGFGPKGSEKEPSEGERKAATLMQRLEGSRAQLDAALKEKPSAAKPGVLAAGVRAIGPEAAANAITGPERQRVEAAQLDILDAALTLGTGAAYTKEQLEGYRKSYFPQLGDDKTTVADKKARLDNVLKAAEIAAGRSAAKVIKPAANKAANIDSLLDKYK